MTPNHFARPTISASRPVMTDSATRRRAAWMHKSKPRFAAALSALVGLAVLPSAAAAAPSTELMASAPSVTAGAETFLDTFTGAPGTPVPFSSPDWDVTVHSRDMRGSTFDAMSAHHGMDCAGPPATHSVSKFEEAVFVCKDHVMTSLNAEGYGVIYLTPDRMVDFSSGEAVVSFDVSTLRFGGRDWWDIWISPYGDHLQLPGEDWYPDLNGAPKNAVHIRLADFNTTETGFIGEIFSNGNRVEIPGDTSTSYESRLVPDAARRDTFELRISSTHIKFGMPKYNLWWIDTSISNLGWNQGVVQLGHHSYNPTKDGGSPGTWHWDNVKISPAKGFTILHTSQRAVSASANATLALSAPAPNNSMLRFSGYHPSANLQFSTDGGASWTNAEIQDHGRALADDHYASYWTPFPAGATSVLFRGNGDWSVRDVTVFAGVAPSTSPGGPQPEVVETNLISARNPARLLDTRAGSATVDGQAAGIGSRGAGATYELQVAGRAGVPASANAVVLNLTADRSTPGFVTAWPCGKTRPNSSVLNTAGGKPVANSVIVELGSGGKVCLFTETPTDLIADVTGYIKPQQGYAAVGPERYLDTRANSSTFDGQYAAVGAIQAGQTLTLPVGGRGSVPGSAGAAVLNVTTSAPSATGYLTVYPCGSPQPTASTINPLVGNNVANGAIMRLGTGGAVCIYSSIATQVIVDVMGYFAGNVSYASINPSRVLDTRSGAPTTDGQLAGIGAQGGGAVVEVPVRGRVGVPANAVAVSLNVTATDASGLGYVTLWPCSETPPNASSLNQGGSLPVANNAIAMLSNAGSVCLYTSVGSQLIVDVTGYFTTTGASSLAAMPVSATPTSAGAFSPLPAWLCKIPRSRPTDIA